MTPRVDKIVTLQVADGNVALVPKLAENAFLRILLYLIVPDIPAREFGLHYCYGLCRVLFAHVNILFQKKGRGIASDKFPQFRIRHWFLLCGAMALKNPAASCEESSIPMEKNILIIAR